MLHLFRPVAFGGGFAAAVLAASGALAGWAAAPTPAAAAITQAPSLSAPTNGSTLTSFAPTLAWTPPSGATQVQLQVTPANNDGPGVNVILDVTNSFDIPAPPDWYGLLPDMGYTWRVRATDATTAVDENSPLWGQWSDGFTFRTPRVDISSVSPFAPINSAMVTSSNPVLTWNSATASVYYWELQMSKDPAFGTSSFLYWVLVHGDVTFPNNAYTVPSSFPLEAGATYYWRVRPRVQGDGTPLPWATAASFKTPGTGALTLQITTPADESVVSAASVTVMGKTAPGAYVTVEDKFVIADASGGFSATVTLTEGVNVLDVIVSDGTNTVTSSLTVSYVV